MEKLQLLAIANILKPRVHDVTTTLESIRCFRHTSGITETFSSATLISKHWASKPNVTNKIK